MTRMCKCTLSLTLLKVRELFLSALYISGRLTDLFKPAHQDFVNIRLGGIDTTGEQGLFSKNSSSGSSTLSYAVAAVVVAVAVAGTIAVFIIRNRK